MTATMSMAGRSGASMRCFFDLVRRGKFELKRLITHEFSPVECVDAYALASERRGQALGILYDWTGLN